MRLHTRIRTLAAAALLALTVASLAAGPAHAEDEEAAPPLHLEGIKEKIHLPPYDPYLYP